LAEKLDAEFEMVEGGGGIFEITVDGELKFSKRQTHRFPTEKDLDAID
jgi:selT/selW/selH-like putative selenoprotein